MGLVDQLVDPASLEAVAVEAAASLASGSLKAKRKPKALVNKLIEDTPLGRSVMWKKVGRCDGAVGEKLSAVLVVVVVVGGGCVEIRRARRECFQGCDARVAVCCLGLLGIFLQLVLWWQAPVVACLSSIRAIVWYVGMQCPRCVVPHRAARGMSYLLRSGSFPKCVVLTVGRLS